MLTLTYTLVYIQEKHGQAIEELSSFDGTSRRRPQLVQSASLAGDMRCFPRITKVSAFKPTYLFARTAYLPFNELPKGRNGRSNVIPVQR